MRCGYVKRIARINSSLGGFMRRMRALWMVLALAACDGALGSGNWLLDPPALPPDGVQAPPVRTPSD
jgi:hypothetical protein